MSTPQAVLFDLDGTLLDTAADLTFALNQLRQARNLPALPVASVRAIANLGAKAMLKLAFNVEDPDPSVPLLRQEFLEIYQQHLADTTRLFPNIENVLTHLEQRQIPWGIVTNRTTVYTMGLLKALALEHRPSCIVCGDTLAKSKPDPLPLMHACQLLNSKPTQCIYIGDAETDVIASKAANIKSLVALYGYIHQDEDPKAWKADGYVNEPLEIIGWLNENFR